MDDFYAGELVWAKFGKCQKTWPAIIVRGIDCGESEPTNGQVWVFWYGDHRHSLVSTTKMSSFAPNFKANFHVKSEEEYTIGVIEAISECAHRAQMNDVQGDEFKLLTWAKTGFKPFPSQERFLPPDIANPVPAVIVKSRCFKGGIHNLTKDIPESAIQKVYNGKLSINNICIACYHDDVVLECPHPLFQGSLCPECKEAVRDNMFITEKKDPETYKCCTICGIGGDVIICDNKDCNRFGSKCPLVKTRKIVYCNACVTVLVGPEEYTSASAQDPWHCYLCQTTDDDKVRGILVKRKEWKDNLFKFYQPLLQPQLPNVEFPTEKRPMRVLSLFDGIATGKVALDRLGLMIDEYFAIEIDPDAINVSKYHYKDSVKHLGRVQALNDERIAELCPIDLLIGGSPCNDLSLVNPTRKGLYDVSGSGILFFEYYRILQKLIKLNGDRPLFWLFENVQAMQLECKSSISRFLGSKPALIDAKNFSPQHRARCYWGNIPGLYSPLPPELSNRIVNLDSVLINQCNRTAAVSVIQTVTTRSNSLRQGKDNKQPVIMDGREDGLWTIELEKIFGFPPHYTDVGIVNKRRQELLGKAWDVQVIEYILNPLKEYFAVKTPKNDRMCENCQMHISIEDHNPERPAKKLCQSQRTELP